VLGCAALVLVLGLREPTFEEVEALRPLAPAARRRAWQADLVRRAAPWLEVPDPPGRGAVVIERYWLSHWSYELEVRRRGRRFVVAMSGVAPTLGGGPWAAVGDGRIEAPGPGFAGATATFCWSCLGARYRHASGGVGRLVFDADGEGVVATYLASESPTLWAKAYGRRVQPGEARPPPFGSLRGQIPCTPIMARLDAQARYRVRVRVSDEAGHAIAFAQVQLKGHGETRRQTDASGRGQIEFRGADMPRAPVLAAGADGFLNAQVVLMAGDDWPGLVANGCAEREVPLVLRAVDRVDHPGYRWRHASAADDPDDLMACGTCHPWHYDQWFESRHARMADNGHVTWERARMLASSVDAPDDCQGCHQPAHAVQAPQAPWKPRGPLAGNHCDFCHKIAGLKDVEASGVLGGYRMLRPDPEAKRQPGGIQHVFGTAPDVGYAYMGASISSLFEGSLLCAGCHQGGGRSDVGSPPKVDTYNEWATWVAGQAPGEVKTCQACHMAAGSMLAEDGTPMDQMAWDAMHRDPLEIHSHRFAGAQPPFASQSLELKVDKRRDLDSGDWIVTVEVKNSGAGHKVPTGTWSKRVIVGVWASVEGRALKQVGGDRCRLDPEARTDVAYAAGDWRSPGGLVLGMHARSDPEGRQAAPPFWAGWPPGEVVDERLGPGETRVATCRFAASGSPRVPRVEIRVIHRRARLPHGLSSVPWTIGPHDPPPEVLWLRLLR